MSVDNLIRDVIKDRPDLADPADIAAIVADKTSTEDLRDYYAKSLVQYVRISLTGRRNRAATGLRAASRSAKVSGIRSWWADMLTTSLSVNGQWKRVGDCTAGDLRDAADDRRKVAAQATVLADFYEGLADLMAAHKVITAADLPVAAVVGLRAA